MICLIIFHYPILGLSYKREYSVRRITSLLLFLSFLFIGNLAADLYDPLSVYLTWQSHPDTTMTIQWISSKDRDGDFLEYRSVGATQWQNATASHTPLPGRYPYDIHRIELTSLMPETAYEFRPGEDAKVYKFRTMPSNLVEPLTFVVGGDVYHDHLSFVRAMNLQAAKQNPAFALVGGDLTYSSSPLSWLFRLGLVSEKGERWLAWLKAWKEDMVTPEGFSIPIIPAIGNHDVMGRFKQTPAEAPFFYALFPFPGPQGYRALDFGDYMSIIVLDTNHTHPIRGKQSSWLATALESRQSVLHKFALYHVGAFPSVRSFKGEIHREIRSNWVPLFEQYGLTAAFEHHDHAYKRTYPLKNGLIDSQGVIYLGDGAWGVEKPRKPEGSHHRWYLAKSLPYRNVIVVTISPKSRYYKAIKDDGVTIDTYEQNF